MEALQRLKQTFAELEQRVVELESQFAQNQIGGFQLPDDTNAPAPLPSVKRDDTSAPASLPPAKRSLTTQSETGTKLLQKAGNRIRSNLRQMQAFGEVVKGRQVVLRVLRATLTVNMDLWGKMDPYAIVTWQHKKDGTETKLGETRVDWGGHQSPEWMHTCKKLDYAGAGSGDTVTIEVRECDLGGVTYDFCGSAKIAVDEIITRIGKVGADVSKGSVTDDTGTVELPLMLTESEKSGTVTVQVLLVSDDVADGNAGANTPVEGNMFQTPVLPLSVSGGTAAFFNLKLLQPGEKVQNYYIGKDLARAEDEVDFYEEVLRIQRDPARLHVGWRFLMPFVFEYLGVANLPVKIKEKPEDLEVLVLENLRANCSKLRLLDLKIGQKTADGGWRGKGYISALSNAVVDRATNSVAEGFRLEGFDGEPQVLKSMDPLLDLRIRVDTAPDGTPRDASKPDGTDSFASTTSQTPGKYTKMAHRIMLQRMNAQQILMHFLDLHQAFDTSDPLPDVKPEEEDRFNALQKVKKIMRGRPKFDYGTDIQKTLSPIELAEITLHEIVKKLVSLAKACRHVPVPQKWIGSSVALGFDCEKLPATEEEARDKVIVKIFDWGRSELNTISKHDKLSEKEKQDRAKFWAYYVGGIDQLAWEAARAYVHQFATPPAPEYLGKHEILKVRHRLKKEIRAKSQVKPTEEELQGQIDQIVGNLPGFPGTWNDVRALLYDYDSQSANDFIGMFKLVLDPADGTSRKAKITMGHCIQQIAQSMNDKTLELEYSVTWQDLNPTERSGRLKGVYRICIKEAAGSVANLDMLAFNASDCYIELHATSHLPIVGSEQEQRRKTDALASKDTLAKDKEIEQEDTKMTVSKERFRFRQQTSVKCDEKAPVWYEVLELPVMVAGADMSFFKDLTDWGIDLDSLETKDALKDLLPNEGQAITRWKNMSPAEKMVKVLPQFDADDDDKDNKKNVFRNLLTSAKSLTSSSTKSLA